MESNPGKLILVVEDDSHVRDSLLELLQMEGYRVVGVPNGLEALNFLHATSGLPSLILLDVMMPIMNGWQFREQQTSDPQLCQIPILLLTADGSASIKAAKMNAQGWLKKPIDIPFFLQEIERCAS